MEGMEWKEWEGKHVFLRTKHNKVYTGTIKIIDEQAKPIIFIHLKDKYGLPVMFASSEIIELKEEVLHDSK